MIPVQGFRDELVHLANLIHLRLSDFAVHHLHASLRTSAEAPHSCSHSPIHLVKAELPRHLAGRRNYMLPSVHA
eukprot:scaffold706_cov418-Prasinococcus_capsulatus_cf.AAC.24